MSEPEPVIVIKKRSRPNARVRSRTPEVTQEDTNEQPAPEEEGKDEKKNIPLEELIELRKLRRLHQGIDVSKLNKGEPKRRKRSEDDDSATTTPSGLVKSSRKEEGLDDTNEENKTRRAVRTNNFTQQTNALDVDKHMMAYIEENMKLRRGADAQQDADKNTSSSSSKRQDPEEDLYQLPEKYKTQAPRPQEEGSLTNSLSMLTAIPEVDLGMDIRLKNIEETEKAKRAVADARRERRHNNDEEHLVATRFYKPNLRQKSDADIIRDAKLEAMGLRPEDYEARRNQHEKPQTATDEMVMERFKKRMRK